MSVLNMLISMESLSRLHWNKIRWPWAQPLQTCAGLVFTLTEYDGHWLSCQELAGRICTGLVWSVLCLASSDFSCRMIHGQSGYCETWCHVRHSLSIPGTDAILGGPGSFPYMQAIALPSRGKCPAMHIWQSQRSRGNTHCPCQEQVTCD